MFQNAQELKDFIVWAKQQGVQALTVGDVAINFNPYAVLEMQEQQKAQSNPQTPEPAEKNEDEDLLFWSSTTR